MLGRGRGSRLLPARKGFIPPGGSPSPASAPGALGGLPKGSTKPVSTCSSPLPARPSQAVPQPEAFDQLCWVLSSPLIVTGLPCPHEASLPWPPWDFCQVSPEGVLAWLGACSSAQVRNLRSLSSQNPSRVVWFTLLLLMSSSYLFACDLLNTSF